MVATEAARRRQLFGDPRKDEKSSYSNLSSSASAADSSAAAQQSLLRSLRIARASLEQSQNSIATLHGDRDKTEQGLKLTEEFQAETRQSERLLAKKAARERTDKLLLGLAFCFFALVVVYILQSRLPSLFPFSALISSVSYATSLLNPFATFLSQLVSDGTTNSRSKQP